MMPIDYILITSLRNTTSQSKPQIIVTENMLFNRIQEEMVSLPFGEIFLNVIDEDGDIYFLNS